MMVYLVSDLHFFHKNILTFTTRPYEDLPSLHEGIVKEWNRVVGSNDTVYHLGDLSFNSKSRDGELYDILNRLNGNLVCLKGNHDNRFRDHIKAQESGLLRTNIEFINSPYKELRHDKRKVILCHYPIICWNGEHRGVVHAHGHTHNSLAIDLGRALDVSYDALWENCGLLRPISIEEFFEVVDKKDLIIYDQHRPVKK